MSNSQTIKFSRERLDFFQTLNKRVNEYFKTNNISRHGDWRMYIKTIFMFSLYFVPYFVLLLSGITNMWLNIGLVVLMGFGVAGIGLSVMHDACHGSYSKNKKVNHILGFSLNLIGGHAFNWKLQHNVLHHSFTNIHEHDEDIQPRGVIRMEPYSKWKPIYKYQHLYAWFFYGFLSVSWVLFNDISRIIRYTKTGLVAKQNAKLGTELAIMIASKLFYFGYMIVLPTLITPFSLGEVLLGVLIMHYIAGFTLAVIFQPAHVVEGTEYPLPDENGSVEHNWAVLQLYTTANFAKNNRIFSWYVGGLNYQIEHHLFPHICHIHYRKVSDIVEATAKEFGIPYRSIPTFREALLSHGIMLKKLGQKEIDYDYKVSLEKFAA
jgi:linoleoyl-CoA desaturase